MTEQLAAENVETAPQVEEPNEEQANSEVIATETPEALAEGEGDTFIPEDKMSGGVQKRINKLTWEKHEAERKAASEIQDLKAKLAAAQVAPQSTDQAPTLQQFDYDEEKYQAALIDHRVSQRLKEIKPEPAPVQQAVDPMVTSFLQKRQKYAESNTEYTQLSTDPSMANAIAQGSAMESYIIAAEHGPKLHHHLLNNAAELIRIQALPEWAQGAELTKIESKLNQVKSKAKSKAPEPVKPVSNGKQSGSRKSSSSPFPY